MKKIFSILVISLILISATIKAQITVEAFPTEPQSGPHNYFGVRVTLAQTYTENVTITGYIYDEGGGPNTNHPFSLTVIAGDLTAETAANFYETDPTASAVAEVGTIVTNYAGVPITYESNGCILKFNSIANALTVIEQLFTDNESYNDDYDSQYPNLSEEELDDMDEQNGFDEFKKYRDFENLFGGFCSKRAEIENTENAWLANNFSGTDPDDIDLTFDDAENTIFNNNYSFKIGNDIYQLTSSGMYINGVYQDEGGSSGIMNRDKNKIELAIREFYDINKSFGPMVPIDYANITFGDCKTNKRKVEFREYDNGNQRIKIKVAVLSIAIKSSVHGKVVHHKKKNGHWKRSRASMAVGCGGTIYDGDCSGSFQFIDRKPYSGFKKKRQLSTRRNTVFQPDLNSTLWKAYSGQVASTIDTPSSISGTLVLTF